jgi:putative DNA primase/helicase
VLDDPRDPESADSVDAIVSYATRTPLTDAGNAELFAYMFGDLVRYDHLRKRWLVWESHRWRPDGDGTVQRMALQAVRIRHEAANDVGLDQDARRALSKWAFASESKARLDALLGIAKSVHPIADDGLTWDSKPWLLGVPNGVVDLRTGELRDGESSDCLTMQAGVDYDPRAKCPRWREFVREVLAPELDDLEEVEQQSRQMAVFVQRLAGLSLTGDPIEHILIFLKGIGGNGKSTLVGAFSAVAGDYACALEATAVQKHRYDRHSTEVADLRGSRFAYCEELGDERLNADRLKHLSGSPKVKARKLYEDGTTFPRTWTLWLSTNGMPTTDDTSWGFWRRVMVLDFPHVFKQADEPTLAATLEAERQGILTWMVWGAKRFYDDGCVLGDVPAAVAAATQEYREDVDPLEALFDQAVLVEAEGTWASADELFQAYQAWAAAAKLIETRRMGSKGFGSALANRPGINRHKLHNVRGYRGVKVGDIPFLTLPDYPEEFADASP